MAQPYLPKRKSGTENRFPDPPQTGVWDERPQSHLGILGEAVEVASVSHRIHSIPDPWARAILFDRALYDEDHVLHEQVRGEWRGLLALLALRERRGFHGLSAREVDLDPDTGTPGGFSAVVKQLLPANDNLISAETKWDHFYTLRWHRQPHGQNRPRAFAMTSPTTLVCTGADYRNALSEAEIPWFSEGFLRDPKEHLGARERHALAEWLLLVSNGVVKYGHKSPRSNWIVRTLRSFASDLDTGVLSPESSRSAKGDSLASTVPAGEILGETSLGMTYGVYIVLDRGCNAESQYLSDVEIVGKPGAHRYLLIDPTIAEQWRENPREITVFGDITLATASRLTSSGKTLDSLGHGVFWCTPAHLFADRLLYESNPDPAFPGCLPVKFAGSGKRRNVVLPLHPDVLHLFTPQEIADNFSIEWLPNGGATCRLRLTLKSGDGRERSCQIQKTYAAESETTNIRNLPMICLWPDFQIPGSHWKAYYTFQFWPAEKEELSVRPWSAAEREPAKHRKYLLDKQRFQVFRTDAYPEALICETPYFSTTSQREKLARGLLLLQPPPVIDPAQPSSVVVGIDFGSTGSNVYVRVDRDRPRAVVFRSRVKRVTDFDVNKFPDICRNLFVPARDWPAESILSLFQDFGDPPEGDGSRMSLRDGHVLYADDPTKLISGDRRRVRANLKWGEERERIAARDFLMQLCLQTAAEMAANGAREVDIRFSYPTAFSKWDLAQFQAYWQNVTEDASELTGVKFRLNRQIDNREAIVATRFFSDFVDENDGRNDRMDIAGGAITVDIGGGTTDFAVWKERKLLAHSSVILAGRDILLAPLHRKPQILTEIDPQVQLDGLQGGERDAAFNAQLDAVISKYGKEMIDVLHIRQARQNVQGLLSILGLGLCGLTFYAGLIVRRLAEAQKFGQDGRLQIFVGGNGSKMFSWCSLGIPVADAEIHERAAKAFLAGAGLEKLKVHIQLSPRPKSEVAHGLVCDKFPLDADAEDFARPMAGEKYKVGGQQQDWKTTPAVEDISGKRVFADRSFPIFTQFLSAIGRPVSEDALTRIGGFVDTRFAQQAQDIEDAKQKDHNKNPAEVLRNEPVFIMALKRYLEMETDDWARRF
jgi:hypothetical protein